VQTDLVLFSLGGVQRFLSESRTTADVAGASQIVQELSRRAAEVVGTKLAAEPEPYGLIVPVLSSGSDTQYGTTNKIAFLAAPGKGAGLAREVAAAVSASWEDRVRRALPDGGRQTPGTPDISWVCVSGSAAPEAYPRLWERARAALVARRRTRTFTPMLRKRTDLCSQAPHLPAVAIPRTALRHERGSDERLSAAGWVKRMAAREGDVSFPSTVAIASASYRAALVAKGREAEAPGLAAAVRRLAECVEALRPPREKRLRLADVPEPLRPLTERLGAWVYPERWDVDGLLRAGIEATHDAVERGRAAAARLLGVAKELGVRPPTPYYAVVVQDLDRLGEALGRLTLDQHRAVSRTLGALAGAQWRAATGLGRPAEPIYAGGDDFLAFCPAASALELAAAIRGLVAGGPLDLSVTASTAVVYAHMANPMQEVIEIAHGALKAAKDADGGSRDALAVVVRRRGGERARTIQPWGATINAGALLEQVRPAAKGSSLSPALASRLELDERSFGDLANAGLWGALSAELQRLVRRQGGSPDAAAALEELGRNERSGHPSGAERFNPVPAALTARFLTQECR